MTSPAAPVAGGIRGKSGVEALFQQGWRDGGLPPAVVVPEANPDKTTLAMKRLVEIAVRALGRHRSVMLVAKTEKTTGLNPRAWSVPRHATTRCAGGTRREGRSEEDARHDG